MKKWHLVVEIAPILILVFILKIVFHRYGLDVVPLNALFTSLLGATIFLIGFLLSGMISDYKESEKLPGEMSASLLVISDEIYILHKNKKSPQTTAFLQLYQAFLKSILEWFYRRERSQTLMDQLHQMNDYFSEFENVMQAGFLSRMKNEQSNLRKMIIRINSIRDLSFVPSAYVAVEVLTFFLVIGMLILDVDPFYECLFFTMVVSFLVIYMIFLLKDLDNPFDYSKYGETGTNVSIKPIHDIVDRLE